MLQTKAEALRSFFVEKTPIGCDFSDYVSDLNEENVYTFVVNKENVDIEKLIREISERGFFVLDSEERNDNKIFFRIKET